MTDEVHGRMRAMRRDILARIMREGDEMHAVWHDFQRKFFKGHAFDSHRYNNDGYFANDVLKWIREHEEDAALCHCDDDHHASSEIILIRHKPKDGVVHGITFIYLAQMGDERTGFFYPGHSKRFLKELSRLSELE